MTWTVNLAAMEAVHSGLRVKFAWRDGGWDGKPTTPLSDIPPADAARLMREAGEAFAEALRGSAVKHRCLRCGHGWNPRVLVDERPRICPACKTPYWDRPRR